MASGDGAAWKRRMELQNERRKAENDLWRRLDDLVTDASEFPHAENDTLNPPSLPHVPPPAPARHVPRAAWPR